ncbi:MAG: LytTR family transcriptional regulator [Reichenbachiella sp.]
MKSLKTSLKKAYEYDNHNDKKNDLIVLTAENDKDKFSIKFKNLVYIQSEENYISIFHLSNNNLNKTLFRKSLKSVLDEVYDSALIRCHRSYIINLQHLSMIEGNKNKLQLLLDHVPFKIPVSRNYADAIINLVDNK